MKKIYGRNPHALAVTGSGHRSLSSEVCGYRLLQESHKDRKLRKENSIRRLKSGRLKQHSADAAGGFPKGFAVDNTSIVKNYSNGKDEVK